MEAGRAIEAFSEDELREYSREHVLYEITHFVRAVQAIEAASAGLFPMNFAIEVFALHLRNLLDFFAPRNPRKTDACAAHFYADWKAPQLNVYLREARWMADKHIAHLTTDRTSDIDLKAWAVEPIVYSLAPIIELFSRARSLSARPFTSTWRSAFQNPSSARLDRVASSAGFRAELTRTGVSAPPTAR